MAVVVMAKQNTELFSSLCQCDFVLTIIWRRQSVCFTSQKENLTWQRLNDSNLFDFRENPFKVLDFLMSRS